VPRKSISNFDGSVHALLPNGTFFSSFLFPLEDENLFELGEFLEFDLELDLEFFGSEDLDPDPDFFFFFSFDFFESLKGVMGMASAAGVAGVAGVANTSALSKCKGLGGPTSETYGASKSNTESETETETETGEPTIGLIGLGGGGQSIFWYWYSADENARAYLCEEVCVYECVSERVSE